MNKATNIVSQLPQTSSVANDIRDIKPPVVIHSGWELLWWTLTILLAVALVVWAWRYWQKRRAQVLVVPPIPAHIRAKQKLQEALAFLSQPKPFCVLVSDTIRGYLEERFTFHAPERTTEEFLYELKETDRLTRDQKESLGEFLQSCDLVKFAKYEPGEPELRDLHDSALRLVEETEPPTAGTAVAGAGSIQHPVSSIQE
jgi:hypothetical protein